jgi:hypothetical protein
LVFGRFGALFQKINIKNKNLFLSAFGRFRVYFSTKLNLKHKISFYPPSADLRLIFHKFLISVFVAFIWTYFRKNRGTFFSKFVQTLKKSVTNFFYYLNRWLKNFSPNSVPQNIFRLWSVSRMRFRFFWEK